MSEWRLIKLETWDAAMNMAIDEAILNARIRGEAPNTVRLYKWRPSAVSIGRHQSLSREVDLSACKKLGVSVVRRISGGGAVYHDYVGEVTYSVVAKTGDVIPYNIHEAYMKICLGIINALKNLGFKSKLDSLGCPSIFIDGKKISGNAQAWRGKFLLQHGTFLLKFDPEVMFTVLKAGRPIEQRTRLIKSAREKVTSLRDLGLNPSLAEVEEALIEGFIQAFDIEFVEEKLTREERKEAERLVKERYGNPKWTAKFK